MRGPYQGEHKPDLLLRIEDRSKDADFNGVVSWKVIVVTLEGTVVVNDTAPQVTVDPINPWKVEIRHLWTSPETARVGRLYAEAEATWPGAAKQTFRPLENAIDVLASGA